MRCIVHVSLAAAAALPAQSIAGVSLVGGGWSMTLDRLDHAMSIIDGKGDPRTRYVVHAASGKQAGFLQPSNSTLTWGESPGRLVLIGDVTVSGTLLFEVFPPAMAESPAAAGFEHDRIEATGDITLNPGATLQFVFSPGLTFRHGDSITLMAAGHGHSILADLNLLRDGAIGLPDLPAGNGWQLLVVPGGFEGYGGDSLVLMAVPMPGPAALFALAAVTGTRRRRR